MKPVRKLVWCLLAAGLTAGCIVEPGRVRPVGPPVPVVPVPAPVPVPVPR